MMRYWSYGPDYYSGFSVLGFLFQVLFWWLIIMLIIKLFKWAHRNQHEGCGECCSHEEGVDSENSNINIVKQRYAKGEIDKKEFEQLKKDLS